MSSQDPTRMQPGSGSDEEAGRRLSPTDRDRAAERREKRRSKEPLDEVEEADRDSFPASDPPSWTGVVVNKHSSA